MLGIHFHIFFTDIPYKRGSVFDFIQFDGRYAQQGEV